MTFQNFTEKCIKLCLKHYVFSLRSGNKCSDSPRTQIPGRIDGVAAVVSKAHSDVEDDEADVERDEPLGDGHVALVCDGAHAEQEEP